MGVPHPEQGTWLSARRKKDALTQRDFLSEKSVEGIAQATESSDGDPWCQPEIVGKESVAAEARSNAASTGNRASIRDGSWSGRRDSNPRHPAWKARALPTELLPLNSLTRRDFDDPRRRRAGPGRGSLDARPAKSFFCKHLTPRAETGTRC